MKQLLSFLLLSCAFIISAMEQPPAASNIESIAEPSPVQIAQAARKDIILKGPEAELHRQNSLIWAYMHPQKTQFSEQGLKFPHFKYSFVTYEMKWDDAIAQLQEFKKCAQDESLDIEDFAFKLMQNSPAYRFTLAQKLVIQRKFLRAFESNENKTPCGALEKLKLNRALYKKAFSLGNWQELPALAVVQLHCPTHDSADSMQELIETERTTAGLRVILATKKEEQELAQVLGVLLVTAQAHSLGTRQPSVRAQQMPAPQQGSQDSGNGGLQCIII